MKRAATSSDDDPENSPQRGTLSSKQVLSTLKTPVSPPQIRRTTDSKGDKCVEPPAKAETRNHDLAAIEAGQVQVEDHVKIFSEQLSKCTRPVFKNEARISQDDWVQLYRRNEHSEGRHFVIHQHDHPVAGPHYDLRLQFSESSSVSWSIMYGLPGDPNSERLNRNATETRVHCLWNHLIETASAKTGSLIIWDTGEYEILPYEESQSLPETDDSRSIDSDGPELEAEAISHSQRLKEAFKNRKIRLRLHGTRLPNDYTLIMRMDKKTDFARPIRKGPKRRRRAPRSAQHQPPPPSTSSSDAEESTGNSQQGLKDDTQGSERDQGSHSDDDPDIQIQKNNAYPGSSNSIGSIHQRKWYLSLARESCGFEAVKRLKGSKDSYSTKREWKRKHKDDEMLGFESFYVRGPEFERSIVTGRLGRDVIDDEKVTGFQPRNGWRPILN